MSERVLLIDGLRLLDHDGREVAVLADRPEARVLAIIFSYAMALGNAAQQAVLAAKCLRVADGVDERTQALRRFSMAMLDLEVLVTAEALQITPPAPAAMN